MKKNDLIEALLPKGYDADSLEKMKKEEIQELYNKFFKDVNESEDTINTASNVIGEVSEASEDDILSAKELAKEIQQKDSILRGQPIGEAEKSKMMTTKSMMKNIKPVDLEQAMKKENKYHAEVYVDGNGTIIPKQIIKIDPVASDLVDVIAIETVPPFIFGGKQYYFQAGVCYSVPRELKASLKAGKKIM